MIFCMALDANGFGCLSAVTLPSPNSYKFYVEIIILKNNFGCIKQNKYKY